MALLHRSYGGKLFRPKPTLHETENFTVIVTAWGNGENTQGVVDEISKYVSAAMEDVEVTSPFEYIAGLSDEANYLRIACMLANDFVYRGENRNEYTNGYEVMAFIHTGDQLAWAQVGGPHLLYKSKNLPVMPLAPQIDLSLESFDLQAPAPLPSRLLGLEKTCHVHCGDFKTLKDDQVILTSSSRLPKVLWQESSSKKLDIETLTGWMAKENPEMPFWLGLLNI